MKFKFKILFYIAFIFNLHIPILAMEDLNSWLNTYPEDSPYEVLSVNKDQTPREIQIQYYKLARKWHPDKFADKSSEEQKEANEMFKKISMAFNLLHDENSKKAFDENFGRKVNFPEETRRPQTTTKPFTPKEQGKELIKRYLFLLSESPVLETKEWYMDQIIEALEIFKPSNADLTKKIINALDELIEIYQRNNNVENIEKYMKLKSIMEKNLKEQQTKESESQKLYKEQSVKEFGENLRKLNPDEAYQSVKRELLYFNESPVLESKEWYMNKILIALDHVKFSDPDLKRNILSALEQLIELYQKENNIEKVKDYTKVALDKAQEWTFESFEKKFKAIIESQKPIEQPYYEEKKPQQPKQKPLRNVLTRSLQELFTTLEQLEITLRKN